MTVDANYQALGQYLDVDNLIDYCLLHIYAYAEDWTWHNYTAQRQTQPRGPLPLFGLGSGNHQ